MHTRHSSSRLLPAVLALLLLTAPLACEGDGSCAAIPDVPTDQDIVSPPDAAAELSAPETQGFDLAEETATPYPDGARAFVAAVEDLIGGPSAAGTPGDIVLRNAFVRFVVRNQERSLLSPYGGALVDADVVRPEGVPGEDRFFEVFPMIGFGGAFRAEQMEIVDDGLLSGTAIVRFTGSDGGMTIIDSLFPTTRTGLSVTLDYILRPDARHLEMVTTVGNPHDTARVAALGVLLQLGNRLQKFFDGCGEDQACLMSNAGTRWLAASSEEVSYGFALPGGESLSLMIAEEELFLLSAGNFRVEPGTETVLRQYLAVGQGTVDEVVRTLAALRGESPGVALDIDVSLGDGHGDVRKAYLRARAAEAATGGWRNATRPGADGRATMHLPPGTWDLVLSVPGTNNTFLEDVVVGEQPGAPVAMSSAPAGYLRVRITDGEGAPVTGALVLQSGLDAAWRSGLRLYEAVHAGDRTIPLHPGDYTATLSRGLAWTIDRQNVTVAPGVVTELSGTIAPAYDTSGGLMMNTHEHCEYSLDSEVFVEDRVWNAVANGIDIMNPTDHDFFASHQGTIERLGLADEVHSFTGCEVSPLWGHTTATGCLAPPDYDTYYAVSFTLYDEAGQAIRGMTATEIYETSREVFQCEFLAVNHPYRGQATFDTYDITASSDPADALPDLDLRLVDAVEVYNKSDDLDTILEQNLPAWFNLLNRGYAIAAIGGSDEHGYNGNYGNPRNWVPVSGTVADGVDQTEVFDAVKAFRSLVLGGPFLRVDVNGVGMGETAVAVDGSVNVHLEVLAPPWMGLSFARLYVNGQLAREFTPLAEGPSLRLDERFELTLAGDAHLVVVAGSLLPEHDMRPVSGKNPLSVTNPVFVDVDGGGYTPPGGPRWLSR